MYINGEWVNAADAGTRKIIDPATSEVIATVPEATAADVDKAVKAARQAFDHTNWGAATMPSIALNC